MSNNMLGNKDYNGWQNRETWVVNLHLDSTFYDYANEMVNECDPHEEYSAKARQMVNELALQLESMVDEILDYDNMNSLARDLMGYSIVNFHEIAQHHLQNAIESTIIDNTDKKNGLPNEIAAAWMILLDEIKEVYI